MCIWTFAYKSEVIKGKNSLDQCYMTLTTYAYDQFLLNLWKNN